jgi:hypothetical protein
MYFATHKAVFWGRKPKTESDSPRVLEARKRKGHRVLFLGVLRIRGR